MCSPIRFTRPGARTMREGGASNVRGDIGLGISRKRKSFAPPLLHYSPLLPEPRGAVILSERGTRERRTCCPAEAPGGSSRATRASEGPAVPQREETTLRSDVYAGA